MESQGRIFAKSCLDAPPLQAAEECKMKKKLSSGAEERV
jgi:hypothetical protein